MAAGQSPTADWPVIMRSGWILSAYAAARIIACIEDPEVIEKIFTHLYAKAGAPEAIRRPPCRASPQTGLFA